jgi:hypothetical protein
MKLIESILSPGLLANYQSMEWVLIEVIGICSIALSVLFVGLKSSASLPAGPFFSSPDQNEKNNKA